MKIHTLYLGDCYTNCYIVSADEKNCIVIDPASPEKDYSGNTIHEKIQKLGYTLKAILLTHGHFDHIYGLDSLINKFDVPVYIHKDEVKYLTNASYNLSSSLFGVYYTFTSPVKTLNDNDNISISGLEFSVLHTPGHTQGSVCFVFEKEKVIFSGDTLFASTIGRTDFVGGDFGTLINSLGKIKKLNGDYDIYPGHNAMTTLSREKKFNEYMI